MADRRRKHEQFVTRQTTGLVEPTYDAERVLTVMTYARGSRGDTDYDHVFDVSDIMADEVFPSAMSGLDAAVRDRILGQAKFKSVLVGMVRKIEQGNYRVVGICCRHGRHRLVALAEQLRTYYPKIQCVNLALGRGG